MNTFPLESLPESSFVTKAAISVAGPYDRLVPAFVLATLEVHDVPAYVTGYVPGAVATMADYEGVVLAVQHSEILQGTRFSSRNVILGFPDMESLLGWYRSPGYQEFLAVRFATSTGSLIAIDGTGEPSRLGSAYIMATTEVVDAESYAEKYAPVARTTIAAHDGRVLAGGAAAHVLEGEAFGDRSVLVEFPDLDAALTWYRSPGYQAVAPVRQAAGEDSSTVAVVGVPGSQRSAG